MPHYGKLGNYVSDDPTKDIRGRNLYGDNDQKLGTVEDVIFDHSTGEIAYIVVDTGGWLKSKEFIVPSEYIRVSSEHADDFACDLTRQQVEKFRPYDETLLGSEDDWADYEITYRQGWDSLIMDRERIKRPVGGRWDQFQDLLRQRRDEIVSECNSCAEEADEEDLRKAG